ncbi:MAG: translesion DNA synthesis-associated protein ImuA [Pseudomonadota bacterium]
MSALPIFSSVSQAFQPEKACLSDPFKPGLEGVWRADELADALVPTLDTGYPELNAVLPGGGWPLGAMTELLQALPGWAEWGLIAPALVKAAATCATAGAAPRARRVVLVAAPFMPFGPALAARALDPRSLLCIQADASAGRLWAAEQALRCAEVHAVLAWLPRVQMPQLRRLHRAAQEYGKLLFVFRPVSVREESSPAPLRLLLSPGVPLGSVPTLQLQVFKRRGPPLQEPLTLCTATPRLQALLAASRAQARQRRNASLNAAGLFKPSPIPSPAGQESQGALDRIAAAS